MFERARQIIKTKQAAPPLNLSPVPTHIMRVAGIEICLLLDLWSAQKGIPASLGFAPRFEPRRIHLLQQSFQTAVFFV